MGARSIIATAAALGLAGCGGDGSVQPNLLLVTVDSLRADRLGCYGGEPGVGARICALGDGGIRYAWAFATASTSAPAVASILTSRYPSDHGVQADPVNFLRSSSISLAEELRAAGYLTAAVVSSPELNRSRNLHQGFAHFDDRMSESRGVGHLSRQAVETTDAALAWLRSAESPWFLWVHYRDLYGPYEAVDDLPAAARPAALGSLGRTLDRELPVLDHESGRGGIPPSQAIAGLTRRSHYEAAYDGVLRRVDREIGRLIDELEAEAPRLGVLLTADHGMAFGEDDRYLVHGHSLGLEQIRVPLLWRPPRGMAANGAAEGSPASPSSLVPRQMFEPVSTLAAAPTLLAAAGVHASEVFAGRPLPSAASEAVSDRIEPLFAEHPLRIALISGTHYYARDRAARLTIATGEMDGEPLLELGALVEANARVAELWTPSGGEENRLDAGPSASSHPLPTYEPARPTGIAPYLEPLVADFLARTAEPPPPESHPSE
jgi:arylsulfatase